MKFAQKEALGYKRHNNFQTLRPLRGSYFSLRYFNREVSEVLAKNVKTNCALALTNL